MKISQQRLKQIIAEERIRAIVEYHVPWGKKDFFRLLNEAKWYEKLDPNSIAFKIAMAAGKEYDEALEAQIASRNPKGLSMTRDEYMKQAVLDNATASHKFGRTQPYELESDIPMDDPPMSLADMIRKGMPGSEVKPRQITADTELEKMLSAQDKTGTNLELETWVSPYGYIHALVPNFDKRFKGSMSMGTYAQDEWVYAGEWYVDEKGKPMPMDAQKRFSYGSHGWPRVTKETLALEKENPSPDRDALLGQGEFAKGSIDVQDPTMEEALINSIAEQVKKLLNEE